MPDMTIAQASERYGATKRQIVHWIDRGYIKVEGHGPGVERLIPEDEQRVLVALNVLLRIGFRWEAAAPLARVAVELDGATLRLPGGVTLNIPIEEQAA